jgi:hypothetical protein
MANAYARAQQKLRKHWAGDAQIVNCCFVKGVGEIRGLAVTRGTVSRYKLDLTSDTLTINPVLKAFSWERTKTATRIFTVA